MDHYEIASAAEIKAALLHMTKDELVSLVMRLSRFKKDNKLALDFILFYQDAPETFANKCKQVIAAMLRNTENQNRKLLRKTIRDAMKFANKMGTISGDKTVQIALGIVLFDIRNSISPDMQRDPILQRIYETKLKQLNKLLANMHPDLQYDYQRQLEAAIAAGV